MTLRIAACCRSQLCCLRWLRRRARCCAWCSARAVRERRYFVHEQGTQYRISWLSSACKSQSCGTTAAQTRRRSWRAFGGVTAAAVAPGPQILPLCSVDVLSWVVAAVCRQSRSPLRLLPAARCFDVLRYGDLLQRTSCNSPLYFETHPVCGLLCSLSASRHLAWALACSKYLVRGITLLRLFAAAHLLSRE